MQGLESSSDSEGKSFSSNNDPLTREGCPLWPASAAQPEAGFRPRQRLRTSGAGYNSHNVLLLLGYNLWIGNDEVCMPDAQTTKLNIAVGYISEHISDISGRCLAMQIISGNMLVVDYS